ncbi:MAG: hypothetical protein ACT4NV_10430 [Rhodoferax sp.]
MKALAASEIFAKHIKTGKKALKSEHRRKIVDGRKNKFSKSIDFDEVSTNQRLSPPLKRWDYFLSTTNNPEKMLAVEIHPYKESDLRKKRSDTVLLLQKHCPRAVDEIIGWHVVITSEIRSDQAARFTAETGIKLHRQFKLPET